ncbi:MAG: hypothetical protein JWM32_929 [Verrucomicrobia bacterium]|nr:hypothetical protein [Verrucomicrobiota bacterium]
MKPLLGLRVAVLLSGVGIFLPAGLVRAQENLAATTPVPQLTRAQLDELLGPIALYPDALVALILPAATNPAEIVLAARFLNANGDPAQIDNQPWSDSTKSLARYPDVIKWMDINLEWTRQVGEAFLDQPDELMTSVQRLRATARATGALVDTPQQQVVVDADTIEIVPTQPDVIYVPVYDPEIVYVMHGPGYYPSYPYLTFGAGFAAGVWLSNDFDWHHRTIWVGDHQHDWRQHRDWRRSNPPGARPPNNPGWHQWQPPTNRPRPPRPGGRPPSNIIRPRPFVGPQNVPGAGRPNTPQTNAPRPNDAGRPPRAENNARPTRPPQGNVQPSVPAPTPRPPQERRFNPPNASPTRQPSPPPPVQPPVTVQQLNRATPMAPPRATPGPQQQQPRILPPSQPIQSAPVAQPPPPKQRESMDREKRD